MGMGRSVDLLMDPSATYTVVQSKRLCEIDVQAEGRNSLS